MAEHLKLSLDYHNRSSEALIYNIHFIQKNILFEAYLIMKMDVLFLLIVKKDERKKRNTFIEKKVPEYSSFLTRIQC